MNTNTWRMKCFGLPSGLRLQGTLPHAKEISWRVWNSKSTNSSAFLWLFWIKLGEDVKTIREEQARPVPWAANWAFLYMKVPRPVAQPGTALKKAVDEGLELGWTKLLRAHQFEGHAQRSFFVFS